MSLPRLNATRISMGRSNGGSIGPDGLTGTRDTRDRIGNDGHRNSGTKDGIDPVPLDPAYA